MSKASECVFDAVIAGTTPADMVLEEPDLVAFLDIRPVFAGHTLVVPRTHYPTVSELPAGVAARLWDAGARVASAQRSALGAAGTFFAVNDVISQSVPHVHLHVVPRRPRDGLRGFFWPRTRYADGAEAAATAAALRRALTPEADPGEPSGGPAPSEIRIRPAGPADASAVAALLAGGTLRPVEDPAGGPGYEAALAEIAADPRSDVLVAEIDGAVAGICQLIVFRHIQEQGGLCAEIESMHVAAPLRSHGIGSVLLRAAVDRARAAGCYRIQLTSNKARTDAHRFYARHGFEATHEGFKLYL